MIRGLLFDLDGLLIDSERVVKRVWNLAGQKLGYENIGEYIYNTLGMNAVSRRKYFRETFGEDFPYEEFRKLEKSQFYEIADTEGIAIKPGVKELILYAKQMGYKIALVTSSGKDYALKMLGNHGLIPYFDGFVFGDMVTNSKPDPEIYCKGYEALGLEPEYCIAFEDAPAGVESAAAAGVDVIMVPDMVRPDEETKMRAWRVLQSLDEAIALLRSEARSQ